MNTYLYLHQTGNIAFRWLVRESLSSKIDLTVDFEMDSLIRWLSIETFILISKNVDKEKKYIYVYQLFLIALIVESTFLLFL